MRKFLLCLTVAATLASCANTTAPTTAPAFDFSGDWVGRSNSGNNNSFLLKISVNNGAVNGTFVTGFDQNQTPFNISAAFTGTFEGTAANDRLTVTVSNLSGSQPVNPACKVLITGFGESRDNSIDLRVVPSANCPAFFPLRGENSRLYKLPAQ
jgi:hypothetical protein